MNFKRLFMMLALPLVLVSLPALAQDKVVTGMVTDLKDGKPIAGASVLVKGTNIGTQTKADGSFSLNAPSNATTIVISYVGYTTQELLIGSGGMNVSLVQSASTLNDVVVVAYGTRKKGDLTGSVTSVTAKDFQKGVNNSSEQLLQGKVAGLQVTSGGGSAGGGSKIRIRGGASLNASNDPLIVIDGVPVESNGLPGSANLLNTINPNDIESMSVLKDASATALYGSRASNGVIIITTKKGAKGKVKFNFNTTTSAGVVGKTVGVLNAGQIRTIINNDAAATGINTYKDLLGDANTNWQDQIYQTAMGYDNNISASGSIGNLPFRASLGYLNQDGILKTNNFKRLTSSLSLTPKFFDDHLAVNLVVKGSQTKNVFADEGAIGSAIYFDPTQPVYDQKNEGYYYGGYFEWRQLNHQGVFDSAIDLANRNPLGLLNLRNNTSTVNRLIGNIQLDYKLHFFPDLHVMVNLGLDDAKGSGNDNIDSVSATNYKTGGRKTYYQQKKQNTLADVSLFYAKELKSLNTKFDLLVGHSYQDFVTDVFNYPSFSYRPIADFNHPEKKDTIAGTEQTFYTDKPEYRLESYLSRLNVTIANKFLLTASIRRDASSKFSKDNRVGYFPAFAGAWKLKEEFFKNTTIVSDLKLRLGWGVTGQQDGIGYYSYLPRYTRSFNTGAQYQFGDAFYSYLRPEGYDANLKWETTTTSNIGLDFGFLNNRISGSLDFYKKKTKDLLSQVPVAPGANFVNLLTINVGNMEVKGFEFTLNTTPVKGPNLSWDLGFNISYNKSTITNLLQNQDPNFKGIDVSGIGGGTGNNIGKFAVGYAPYIFNVYKQVYDKQTGKPIEGLYEDINRDGIINDDDRYYYKKPAPDVILGINTQVNYKQFSLGLSAHAYLGNYMYNNFNSGATLRSIKNPINFIGNTGVNYLETGFSNAQFLSDYYVENASFLRLDNINLGYNVGKIFNNKASLRIAGSIQNVFVISKYSGLDPENASDTGVDGNIYPRPHTYSLGLNLDF
ncbi:SusC/RagA family TonB-linked outer membrane protein [Panacibacter ginsenosidivorans]|uniref:SusC/RagA family TonB-linked outer membrane protein n=1 Tax=Panacibacter ginsenosidivorans TaxID=1813871 RepID=A0A5B8V7A0_9BACT|nr:SusC/RagA family TonB-linked outer membrane protein [Panacibacter ginsenosidivorans]QEC67294.1 SusC/RagA family TonB-linked outer membrane protein [Panacibacter ginsenosidivorans]